MSGLFGWIDERTGWVSAARRWAEARVPDAPAWHKVWPATLWFGLIVQAITGFFLWILYSPSAQTAWESVYWLQYRIQGGWLLRNMHHYTAQVMVVLVGIYLVQMIVRADYRRGREVQFWIVLFLGLFSLALLLTGDLLAWDQSSYWSTKVRVTFLTLLPVGGGELYRIAVGGTDFGHLTLSRFLALHIGVFTAIYFVLLLLHHVVSRHLARQQAEAMVDKQYPGPGCSYWPRQALRDSIACAVVMGVVVLLSLQHVGSEMGPGLHLGAPADPADAYAAARPEWAFLGLYEFANLFPGELKIVPIFIIPGLLVVLFLAMPFIGRIKLGYWFNLVVTASLLVAAVVLSIYSLQHDAANASHQAALAMGEAEAQRTIELAQAPKGIPATGALTLLRNDPKTQGPKLFKQHCASCHDHLDPEGKGIKAEESSAPNLWGFANRRWISRLLDPELIGGPEYFGNTAFSGGDMVGYVEDTLSDLEEDEKEEVETMAIALSAQANLPLQKNADAKEKQRIEEGHELMTDIYGCTDCHKLGEEGALGSAPDLSGYGSREWVIGIIRNPEHERFYGESNDRMPAYAPSDDPGDNILALKDVGLIADWLRGDWYRPTETAAEQPQAEAAAEVAKDE